MYNPYQNFGMNTPQNVLPPQQILQANGKASIDALRMSPNSSALIADSSQPIIWRCISDSLGNVSAQAYDIVPHKDEAVVEKENINQSLVNINERLRRLEEQYESFTQRSANQSANSNYKANVGFSEKCKESTNVSNADSKY